MNDELPRIQEQVYYGQINSHTDVLDKFLSESGVQRYNPKVNFVGMFLAKYMSFECCGFFFWYTFVLLYHGVLFMVCYSLAKPSKTFDPADHGRWESQTKICVTVCFNSCKGISSERPLLPAFT